MIDNFEILDSYVVPKNIFMGMLTAYQNIGKAEIYLDNFESKIHAIEENTIENDTFFMCQLLNKVGFLPNITENRMRLIITKNSVPKNNDERMIFGIKKVIETIFHKDYLQTINSSDLLSYLNMIFLNRIKFDQKALKEKSRINLNSNVSTRVAFDRMIEKYFYNLRAKTYEPLILSLITFLETRMIKPYYDPKEEVDPNYVASYLFLYYMIHHIQIKNFRMVPILYKIFNKYDELEKTVRIATVNYGENYFKLNEITLFFLDIINSSFEELASETKKYLIEDKSNKSVNVELTILNLDKHFTKEDIRQIHPYISDSTIMRALIKLREEKLIMPLGTGRNAQWIRLIEDDDPRRFLRK